MKTITEFSGFALRTAHQKSKEIRDSLGTEGRTAEELSTAHREALQVFLTETFKAEGDKLNFLLKAMEVAESKPRDLENLKRIVVLSLGEAAATGGSKKSPGSLQIHEGHAYAAEYLAPLKPKGQSDRRHAGSKHAGDGKRAGKKGRGRRRPDMKGKRPDGGPERRGANPPKPGTTTENTKSN